MNPRIGTSTKIGRWQTKSAAMIKPLFESLKICHTFYLGSISYLINESPISSLGRIRVLDRYPLFGYTAPTATVAGKEGRE